MIRVAEVLNDSEGIAYITSLKEEARLQTKYSKVRHRVRIFGRCHDKVTAFAKTGRYHCANSNSNSIYSLKSPQAPYCYAWAVYLETAPKFPARTHIG